jgi:anti-sigma factor RsiW
VNGRENGVTHEQAWDLLPWLVNDTLEPGERVEVEAHVASCRECREERERCRTMASLVRKAEVAPSPHPAQLARLVQRIDETERTKKGRTLAGFLGGTPSAVRWALVAQAAAVVFLLAVVFLPNVRPAFHVLSDPSKAVVAPGQRQLRVVFAPGTTEPDMRRLLLEVRGEIVGGPSPLGAWVVAVPAAGAGADTIELVLEHLRDDPHVRFAEPVAGGGAG